MKWRQSGDRNEPFSVKEGVHRGVAVWIADILESAVGKRVRMYRPTREEAVAAASEYLSEHRLHGSALSSLTTSERTFILWLRERGVTVETAQKALLDTPAASGLKLETAIAKYMASQKGNDPHHLYSLRSKFSRVEAAFRSRFVSSIRAGEIEIFLRDKGRSKPAYHRVLRAFFNFAVMHDWTEANPVLKVPRPVIVPPERVIFTPEKMKRLLAAAIELENLPMLRLLVFGGFFGLRYKEILRLQVEDVGAKEIFIRRMKTQKKGMRDRYVTVLPNARAWLPLLELPESGSALGVNDKNLRLNREKVLTKANEKGEPIAWPHNVLRRTYGSSHLAAFEDPGLTATQMGHTDPETTVGKYRVARRKAEGRAWFAITPKAVAKLGSVR